MNKTLTCEDCHRLARFDFCMEYLDTPYKYRHVPLCFRHCLVDWFFDITVCREYFELVYRFSFRPLRRLAKCLAWVKGIGRV